MQKLKFNFNRKGITLSLKCNARHTHFFEFLMHLLACKLFHIVVFVREISRFLTVCGIFFKTALLQIWETFN